ncbi:MAG: hypothetical protein ACLPKB_31620 [Xanthobacteraceae bacterium]
MGGLSKAAEASRFAPLAIASVEGREILMRPTACAGPVIEVVLRSVRDRRGPGSIAELIYVKDRIDRERHRVVDRSNGGNHGLEQN